MASYFTYFPNVYVGEGISDDETFKYRLVKNLFRRVRVREDLDQYVTLFESYSIKNDETPSSIAQKFFGDAHLDWVLLLSNNIIDIYDEWPKNETDLQSYVNTVYNDPDSVHHYETNEILVNGVVYIPEGTEVTAAYRTTMPDGTVLTAEQSRYPITNYEHEYYLNEKKRLVRIPTPSLVDLMLAEFEELLEYQPHAELDELNNKKSELSIASKFVNTTSSSTQQPLTSTTTGGAGTTFDYGPTTGAQATAGVVTSTSTTSATGNTLTTTTNTVSVTTQSASSGGSGGSGY